VRGLESTGAAAKDQLEKTAREYTAGSSKGVRS
jgi:hypothetical protein